VFAIEIKSLRLQRSVYSVKHASANKASQAEREIAVQSLTQWTLGRLADNNLKPKQNRRHIIWATALACLGPTLWSKNEISATADGPRGAPCQPNSAQLYEQVAPVQIHAKLKKRS